MREAVELRKFDDLAKELNKITPPIEHFQHYVEASLR
jgi:predicted HD phosphohydrolase